MSDELACAKCGSTQIVPQARILDHGDGNVAREAQVGVYRKPDAMFFKGHVKVQLFAKVCGECGFTEFYAKDPTTLYEAYLESRQDSAEI